MWVAAIRSAMIWTAVLAGATLICWIGMGAGPAAILPIGIPLVVGALTAVGVKVHRARRRAVTVRRLRG